MLDGLVQEVHVVRVDETQDLAAVLVCVGDLVEAVPAVSCSLHELHMLQPVLLGLRLGGEALAAEATREDPMNTACTGTCMHCLHVLLEIGVV